MINSIGSNGHCFLVFSGPNSQQQKLVSLIYCFIIKGVAALSQAQRALKNQTMSQLCKKVIKETWMKTISVSSKPTPIKVLSLILKTCCNKETSTHIHLKVVTRHWSRGLKIVLSIQRPHLHFNWYVSLEIKPVYTEAKEKWNSHETQKRNIVPRGIGRRNKHWSQVIPSNVLVLNVLSSS